MTAAERQGQLERLAKMIARAVIKADAAERELDAARLDLANLHCAAANVAKAGVSEEQFRADMRRLAEDAARFAAKISGQED